MASGVIVYGVRIVAAANWWAERLDVFVIAWAAIRSFDYVVCPSRTLTSLKTTEGRRQKADSGRRMTEHRKARV
ncbi:MAG TPA: hypothetical protein VI386_09165 [Candidatus Sulfotelmatobacter sp.]